MSTLIIAGVLVFVAMVITGLAVAPLLMIGMHADQLRADINEITEEESCSTSQ